uniref:Putative secreted protein n=1 Tax=Anopheles triannulatus TaxID=58253 RepID=A0A2M4B7F4_9DIPT
MFFLFSTLFSSRALRWPVEGAQNMDLTPSLTCCTSQERATGVSIKISSQPPPRRHAAQCLYRLGVFSSTGK